MLDETYFVSGIKQNNSSQAKEIMLRKRIHTLLSDNFQLKEKLEVAERDLKTSQQQRYQLKEHIRLLLDEVTLNDKTIESIRKAQSQRQAQISLLEQQIKCLREQLSQQNEICSKLNQHNHNLQTENQLITQIKHQYSLQLSKIKSEFQSSKIEVEKLTVQNEWLQNQLSRQQEWISNLQSQICARRNDIEQYEKFVLDRLSSARNNQQLHRDCKAEFSRISHKYCKYKAKSTNYRCQRDHLLQQLDILARELDSPGQG